MPPSEIGQRRSYSRAMPVIKAVASAFGLTPAQLRGPRRDPYIVRARFEAYHRLREELELSLPEIGRAMHRDHSTIVHGIRTHLARRPLVSPTRHFVLTGAKTVVQALDRAAEHGEVVGAALHTAPQPAVYGAVEIRLAENA